MKKLTVVLPTYNEKANIKRIVEKVFEQEKNLPGWEINIVIADDIRSSDETEQIAKELVKKNRNEHFIKKEVYQRPNHSHQTELNQSFCFPGYSEKWNI